MNPLCSIRSGMSFQEARQKDAFEYDFGGNDFFFNLGSENDIAIGGTHPEIPGYTFAGWMLQGTSQIVTADTVLTGEWVHLMAAWKKDGSNFSVFDDDVLGISLDTRGEGVLLGANIPQGADIRLKTKDEPFAYSSSMGILSDAERKAIDLEHFYGRDLELFVNGKQVHDGFGSMKLTFYERGIASDEDAVYRVWHKHTDGRVTSQDVKPSDQTITITVSDLSVIAFGKIDKDVLDKELGTGQPGGAGSKDPNEEPPDKKPDGDKSTDSQKDTGKTSKALPATGDDMRSALTVSMALLTVASFTGGVALLMGNRKRPAHRRY